MTQAAYEADTITVSGSLTLAHLGILYARIDTFLGQKPAAGLRVCLDGVTDVDTAGVVFLQQLPLMASARGVQLEIGPLPPRFREFQEFVMRRRSAPAARPFARRNPLEVLGEKIQELNRQLAELLLLSSDLTWAALRALGGRSGARPGALVEQAVALGSSALPIVALILFLVGAVSSLQAVAQLRKFGADIFVADLLAIGITRELGPLMTAIIVAGRSGSAIAAEVATMKYTEELDALQTMSLDPLRFVATPKLWAMVLCMPGLTIVADSIGILGGVSIGVTVMGFSPQTFFDQVLGSLFLRDVVTGLIKSVSFAWAITVLGVFEGLGFRGGPAGVGHATTAAVVRSISAIIVLDCFWGLVFYLG